MMSTSKTLLSAILAGFVISMAAFYYSTMSGAVVGAVIFAFGLITVVLYKMPLYTGSAGFIKIPNDIDILAVILSMNVVGCFATGYLMSVIGGDTQNNFISGAIEARKLKDIHDFFVILIRSVMCGFIMTTAVHFSRRGIKGGIQYFLPLLFGVPLFLLCGFYHSIVDAFYVSYGILAELPVMNYGGLAMAVLSWLTVVLGNGIGCNIQRFLNTDAQ